MGSPCRVHSGLEIWSIRRESGCLGRKDGLRLVPDALAGNGYASSSRDTARVFAVVAVVAVAVVGECGVDPRERELMVCLPESSGWS